MQFRAARIAELLVAYKNVSLAEVKSAVTSSAASSNRTAAGKAKVKLGKDIIADYQTVSIGQSTYFTGAPLLYLSVPACAHTTCCSINIVAHGNTDELRMQSGIGL